MGRRTPDRYHLELLAEVRAHAKPLARSQLQKLQRYIGTSKICYALEADTGRQIVKNWIKKHPALTLSEYVELLNSLYRGESCNEISLAGELLELLPKLRKCIDPKCLDTWLNGVQGWAETDSICQSKFAADEVLSQWKEWQRLLTKLASDSNVHKRRASLVLLTKPVKDSADPRLADMAFATIDRLQENREILVTKAVSWLLRDLIKNHRQRVENYLQQNESTLPRNRSQRNQNETPDRKKNARPQEMTNPSSRWIIRRTATC